MMQEVGAQYEYFLSYLWTFFDDFVVEKERKKKNLLY
jgi:hypothetical protein